MNDRSDATTVSVALSLYQGATVGECPDAEELAALYDDRLTSGRRQEVLSHLANDDSLYSQWLTFFEYAEELGISEQSAIPVDRPVGADRQAHRGQKVTLSEKLARLFNFYTLGSGAALAGVAVFVVFLNVSQPTGLDQLYQQYGRSVPQSFELPTRSLGNFWADPAPEQFMLSRGFKAGLARLNVDDSQMKLLADDPEQPALDSLGKNDRQTLKSVGEWAALTQTQCPGQSADYFTAADEVWATLQARLEAMDAPYATTLMQMRQQASGSEQTPSGRVCKLAAMITQDVRR